MRATYGSHQGRSNLEQLDAERISEHPPLGESIALATTLQPCNAVAPVALHRAQRAGGPNSHVSFSRPPGLNPTFAGH